MFAKLLAFFSLACFALLAVAAPSPRGETSLQGRAQRTAYQCKHGKLYNCKNTDQVNHGHLGLLGLLNIGPIHLGGILGTGCERSGALIDIHIGSLVGAKLCCDEDRDNGSVAAKCDAAIEILSDDLLDDN